MAESQRLARSHMPVASIDRLRELGLDPASYGSCAATNQGSIRGCPFWDSCRFDRKDWGGFKGSRPHNVPYFIRTHEGRKKTDVIACFGFVAGLQARMIEGMAAELRGEKHEFIRIIGKEGDSIPIKIVKEEPLQPGQNRNDPRRLVAETKTLIVPEFPDPASRDADIEYERQLEKLMGSMTEMAVEPMGVDMSAAVAPPPPAELLDDEPKPKGKKA